jgi:hypothetical protein
MHWIESLFGIFPDANSGATEIAFLVALVGVLWGVRRALSAGKHQPAKRAQPR